MIYDGCNDLGHSSRFVLQTNLIIIIIIIIILLSKFMNCRMICRWVVFSGGLVR